MDDIDYKIIEILTKNSRSTNSEISKKVYLSLPAVGDRIKKLEEKGIIKNYTLRLNRKELGYSILAFISVNIDVTENIASFRSSILEFSEVLECHHLVGEYDYLLKVLVRDTDELEIFLSKKLKSIKGVIKSNTTIALSTLKEEINP